MPCFALFAIDFAASNSNRIWYRNYTAMAAPWYPGRLHRRRSRRSISTFTGLRHEAGNSRPVGPLHTVSAFPGHANETTTARSLNVKDDYLQELIERKPLARQTLVVSNLLDLKSHGREVD